MYAIRSYYALSGPTLKFNTARQIVLVGATIDAKLDGEALPMWQVVTVPAGATLHRITSYNVCYTKLLRWLRNDQHGRADHSCCGWR